MKLQICITFGETMKIAIIGAGLTGLTAAFKLKDFAEVTIFEKEKVGGLLASFCTPNYCIEKFYHHCFVNDVYLLKLLKKLNLEKKLVWKNVKVGYAVDWKIYPLNTPLEIIKFPYMSLSDKIRLAIFTLTAKRKKYENFDNLRAIEGIKKELGENLFNNFFLPLLRAKYCDLFRDVSYSWLLARVATRSKRTLKGEVLGYLRGGFHQLIEKLKDKVKIVNCKVKKIEKVNKKFLINEKKFNAVIYTAPVQTLDKKIKKVLKLPQIRYQSSVSVLLASNTFFTEDLYWINVKDAIFGAIIEHTNFMSVKDYGEHLIYLAAYSLPHGWLFKLKNEEIIKIFLKDFEKLGFNGRIKWIKVFKAKYSGPVFERGYIKKITPYRTKIKGFYIAGLTSKSNYPERSMNGSIKAGFDVARIVKNDFKLV